MERILLIDKPQGWTSHDVVARLRTVLRVKKIGHAGTLDPLATGLLIVLVGREATKRQSEFLKLDKSYEVTAQFGLVTDSYDIDGQVVAKADWNDMASLSQDRVVAMVKEFTGQIQQTVPPFSAVKVAGRRLHRMARSGELDVSQLPSREVSVTQFELLHFELDHQAQQLHASFAVSCSSGTYVRSLIHDLGQKLGLGATVTQLRRTRIGEFRVEAAQSLGAVETLALVSKLSPSV